jgi:hypothetical protein
MSPSPSVRLVLGEGDPRTAARLRYAFSAYAALHGFRVAQSGSADVVIGHGVRDPDADITLASGYRPRPLSRPAPPPTWTDGLPCFHLASDGRPDLLGEVFEWLAAPHERACTDHDSVGRVAPHSTLAGSHRIDGTVPWVNRWLARLHADVRSVLPRLPAGPSSPFGGGLTFVASHDLDHLSAARLVNARRVVDNAGVALLLRRDPRTAAQIGVSAVRRAAARLPVADGVRELLSGERRRGIRSTYTVVPASSHPRDPGYTLADDYVRSTLHAIEADGHEIAVHGSYRSLEADGGLAREYDLVRRAGFSPSGGRQHWLRYHGGELFRALQVAGARWDSTSGHPDVVGYRNGAAFPYPPYDLDSERPHGIVEIPLVVMERALCSASPDPAEWAGTALRTLRAAGQDGWGGTAVLWHDAAFTGTALPAPLAEAYWSVLDAGDRWVTADEMARVTYDRWHTAHAFTAPTRSG